MDVTCCNEDGGDFIECDLCKLWQHKECISKVDPVWREFFDKRKKDPKIPIPFYACSCCIAKWKLLQVNDFVDKKSYLEMQEEVQALRKLQVENCVDNKSFIEMQEEVQDLRKLVTTLKGEFEDQFSALKARIETRVRVPGKPNTKDSSSSTISSRTITARAQSPNVSRNLKVALTKSFTPGKSTPGTNNAPKKTIVSKPSKSNGNIYSVSEKSIVSQPLSTKPSHPHPPIQPGSSTMHNSPVLLPPIENVSVEEMGSTDNIISSVPVILETSPSAGISNDVKVSGSTSNVTGSTSSVPGSTSELLNVEGPSPDNVPRLKKVRLLPNLILGSSLVRGTWRYLDTKNTKVVCRPGATVLSLKHEMEGWSPSDVVKTIIVHAGGNDLGRDTETPSPDTVMGDLWDLINLLKVKFPLAHIIINGIMRRKGINSRLISEINTSIKWMCSLNSVGFAEPDSLLSHYHFAKDGVHLNFDGTRIFGIFLKNLLWAQSLWMK